MLELIFQGLVEWIYSLILDAWEHFASSLVDIMSMDFAYLEERIAIIPTIRQAILAIGWALLIGNLIFQAAKTMLSGLGFEGEDPKLLFARTFVFAFLLLASPQICDICLNITAKTIQVLQMPTAVQIAFANESTFVGFAGAWLLVVICGIIVMFKSFKLIIEMAERYFILAMLTISAPLAFATGGSRNTSDIFSGWCRMYGSMCLLMILNVVFVKMLLSVLSYVPSGLDVLPWMVLVLTIVKVAKKADVIVTRIGLNPAPTGDSMGRSFPGMLTYMVARTAISNAAKSFGNGGQGNTRGNNSGGSPPNNNPNVPPSGSGGARQNPAGPQMRGARSAAGTAGTYSQQSFSQRASQQSASNQTAAAQNTSAQFSGPQNTTAAQTSTPQTNSAAAGSSHSPQGGMPGSASPARSPAASTGNPPNMQQPPPAEQMQPQQGTPPLASPARSNPQNFSSGNAPSAVQRQRAAATLGTNPHPAGTNTNTVKPGNTPHDRSVIPGTGMDTAPHSGPVPSNTEAIHPGAGIGGTPADPVSGTAGTANRTAPHSPQGYGSNSRFRNGSAGTSPMRRQVQVGQKTPGQPQNGAAGTVDRSSFAEHAAPSNIERNGTAGIAATADNSRIDRNTASVRHGTAGTPKADRSTPDRGGGNPQSTRSGMAGIPGAERTADRTRGKPMSLNPGAAGIPRVENPAKHTEGKTMSTHSGTAGMPSAERNTSGRAEKVPVSALPGTAGIPNLVKPGVPSVSQGLRSDPKSAVNTGAQVKEHPAPGPVSSGGKASEGTGTLVNQQGPVNSSAQTNVQMREQSHVSVHSSISPASSKPEVAHSASAGERPQGNGMKTGRGGDPASRTYSSKRPLTDKPDTRRGNAALSQADARQITPSSKAPTSQNGTAGKPLSVLPDRPSAEAAAHHRNGPDRSTSRPMGEPLNTARQESDAVSGKTAQFPKGQDVMRRGMAGIAPQTAKTVTPPTEKGKKKPARSVRSTKRRITGAAASKKKSKKRTGGKANGK